MSSSLKLKNSKLCIDVSANVGADVGANIRNQIVCYREGRVLKWTKKSILKTLFGHFFNLEIPIQRWQFKNKSFWC